MVWRNPPTNFNRDVRRIVTDTVREIAVDGLAQVTQGSPVDTGRYKNNHNVGVGDIDSSADRPADRGAAGTSAQQAKLTVLDDFPVVYISNGLPYAQNLEDGASDQAASGVYRPAFTFLAAKYRRVTR